MPTAFQTYTPANVRIERLVKLRIALSAYEFASTTGAIDVGMRQPFKLTRKVIAEMEIAGRAPVLLNEITLEGNCLQTGLANVQNAYLLGREINAFCNVQAENAQGDYYNFIENTGAYGSENGSRCLGLHWKFTITPKQRLLNLKFMAQMTQKEWEWLLTNMGSASTGGAGTTGGPLTSNAVAWNKVLVPGFVENATTVNSVVVGACRDTTFTLESHSFSKDEHEREWNTGVELTAETTMQ